MIALSKLVKFPGDKHVATPQVNVAVFPLLSE